MSEYKELIDQLNGFADWLEKNNNVHCFSVPRRAAITIERLEEENRQMRLQLNKRDLYLSDYINRAIGFVLFTIYKIKKKWKK